MQNAQETEINVLGTRITGVKATVLTASDTHARNTFEQPNALAPVEDKSAKAGSPMMYRFAPASVTRLDLDLA